MNYLAHVFLSTHQPSLLVGNMMTDMMHKHEEKEVSSETLRGVKLHRDIDEITDQHPIFIAHKRTLYPHFRKYSPVVLDIIYDYLLENNWSHFTDETYREFSERTYRLLLEHLDRFPERIQPIVQGMVRGKWLSQYASLEGLQKVFDRLERKVRFPQSFAEVTPIVHEVEEMWQTDHQHFFHDVMMELQKRGWPTPQNEGKY